MRHFVFALCFLSSVAQATISPNLLGGRQVEPGEFEEVVLLSSRTVRCSATIVGKRTLLTAGHCINQKGHVVKIPEKAEYSFLLDRNLYKAKCTRNKDYIRKPGDQDLALCKTNKTVRVRYASVSTVPPKVGETIELTGYGCTMPQKMEGYGILRVGQAEVIRNYFDHSYNFKKRGEFGDCFGDHGSGVFADMQEPRRDHHWLVGVVTKGFGQQTIVASTSHRKTIKWMKRWERWNFTSICGVSKKCHKGKDRFTDCGPELDDLRRKVDKLDKCLAR